MDKHLLTEIEIKNFKCFENFKADGFKRVNLIGGKNNVGKTAFMEACYINVSSINIDIAWSLLSGIKISRNNLEYIGKEFTRDKIIESLDSNKKFDAISNINNLKYSILDKDGKKEYKFKINNKDTIINVNDFSYNVNYGDISSFIDNFGLTNDNMKTVFEAVQKKDKESVLYEYINEFDENILNFKIIGGDKPQCKTIDGKYRDINEFGDGLKHYISIICSLYACEDGYLFIDEIDNGIHYTQLDRLWKIILTVSKEQNVQVFATTHSKECIDSFNRMQKEDKDSSYFEMIKNVNTNKLYMRTLDDNQLNYELTHNGEFRG